VCPWAPGGPTGAQGWSGIYRIPGGNKCKVVQAKMLVTPKVFKDHEDKFPALANMTPETLARLTELRTKYLKQSET